MNFTDTSCSVYSQALNETRDFGTWLSGAPECSWYGVTCSADGIVRAVELINNNLAGVLPHELTGKDTTLQKCSPSTYFVTLSNLQSLLHSFEISSNSCVSGKLPLWHNSFGIRSIGSFVES